MKTKNFFNMMMLSSLLLTSAFVFQACNKDDDDAIDNRSYTIGGNATGAQVVPANTATGTGSISGTYDPKTRVMSYTTNWTTLSGIPTSGGFYNGTSGTTGTSVGDAWNFESGATATGSRTSTMTLTQAQADQLTSGNWYYSYGTTANPNGEVRGQITATR